MRIHQTDPSPDGCSSLPNELIEDDRLTDASLGLLVRLLHMDESADATIENLRSDKRGGGRKAISNAFAELEEFGYIVRSRKQGERGWFVSSLDVYDTPGHGAASTKQGAEA
jgi:hypothetical protein